jgi:monofunctional chorismate mutase
MWNENSQTAREHLEQLRTEIDEIDSQIATLLSRRHEVVIEIGKLKHATGVQVYDDTRERFVLERVAAKGHDAKCAQFIKDIYKHIMAGSRAVQADGTES